LSPILGVALIWPLEGGPGPGGVPPNRSGGPSVTKGMKSVNHKHKPCC